jgi:hypothetical protein
MKTLTFVPLLLALAAPAHAQDDSRCPLLPAETGLTWKHQAGKGFDFCSAVRADGSQAFGVFLGKDSPFDPKRSNREEQAVIDGREVHWYRGEVAGDPAAQVRETLLQLRDGRVAHIFLQARDREELVREQKQVQALRFDTVQLSGR